LPKSHPYINIYLYTINEFYFIGWKDAVIMAARVVKALCIGCGACTQMCPYGAITVKANQAHIDSAKCDECEECIFACPNGAIII